MNHYVVYKQATGLVVQSGSTAMPISEFEIGPDEEVLAVSGYVPFDETAVINSELVSIGKRPSIHHEWNGTSWNDSRSESVRVSEKWVQVRATRNYKLQATDWVVLPDSPVSEAERTAWLTYRNVLRNIPNTNTDPFAIEWPVAPNSV